MATVIEKRNKAGELTSYKIMVCVGRDEANRQIWRTTTLKRPKNMTPARERKEIERQADAWEQAQREEYQRTGAKTDDKDKITLARFIDAHWIPDFLYDGTHKPAGIVFYKNMVNVILSYPKFTKIKLTQVNTEAVKRFIGWLNKEARTQKGEPYSAESRVHIFGALRNIMGYAKRMKYIKENPLDDLTAKERPHKEQKPVDFLDAEQAKRFLAALEGEPLFWQTYVQVLLFTGLRRGEALGLRWADVDTDSMVLKVDKNVTIDKDSPDGYAITTTKTGKSRTVPIPERLLSMLLKLKRERETELQLKLMPTTFIFCRTGEPAKPLYLTSPTRWMKRFTERHGLKDVSPHDLRHTAATLMLAGGAQLKDAQAIMGHADVSTMLRFYVGTSEQGQRNAISGTETLLQQGGK